MHVGVCRGYGFIEFDTKEAANEAARAMNLFDLGGQSLRVGRVVVESVIVLLSIAKTGSSCY